MPTLILHLNDYGSSLPRTDQVFDVKWRPRADDVLALLREGHYLAVARSEIDDVEKIYVATQNGAIHDSWSREVEGQIVAFGGGTIDFDGKSYGYRSTSVGDLLVVDGQAFVCAQLGFDKVDVSEDVLDDVAVMGGGTVGELNRAAPAV